MITFLQFMAALCAGAGDRCLIFTDNAYIAYAGCLVEKGDLLCVLLGCRLPVVLRPRGDTYQMLSMAWCADDLEKDFEKSPESFEKRDFCLN